MTPRIVVLGLFLSAAAFAAKSAKVNEAILLYDKTDFVKAKDKLVTLIDAPGLNDEDRAQALIYLAASYHALNDTSSAKAQLMRLARNHPGSKVDPGLFLPELVALADEARGEVAREDPPAVRVEKPVTGPVDPKPGAPQLHRPAPVGYAFVPFGVGQFKNGDGTKGWLFLGGEVLTLGTFALTLGMFESSKKEGQFLRWGRFEDPAQAATLHTVYMISFWTGLALVVGGVIDAVVSRPEPETLSLGVSPGGVVVRF
jgi:hypothetical protein